MNHDLVRILLALTLSALLACGKDSPNIFHVELISTLDEGRDIELVSLPGGNYIMGSKLDSPYIVVMTPFGPDTTFNPERPVHLVTISPFLISSTEITHEQYAAITGRNPSQYSGEPDMPVEKVSWYDAADFCNELSDNMGLNGCYDRFYACDFSANGFRLPTESEWEYAARGGGINEYYFGNDPSVLTLAAWFIANSENRPHPVARKTANNYGLYDMHGNISEWCQDYYNFYSCSSQQDPTGPDRGFQKVARGGSWASVAKDCRSAHRLAFDPSSTIASLGFRIVRRQ